MADYSYSSAPRPCGGSHTLTYPYRRIRLQHLSQGLYPTEEIQIAMKVGTLLGTYREGPPDSQVPLEKQPAVPCSVLSLGCGFLIRPSQSLGFFSFPGKKTAIPATWPIPFTLSLSPFEGSEHRLAQRGDGRGTQAAGGHGYPPVSTARRGGHLGPGRTYLQGTDGHKATRPPEQRQ